MKHKISFENRAVKTRLKVVCASEGSRDANFFFFRCTTRRTKENSLKAVEEDWVTY